MKDKIKSYIFILILSVIFCIPLFYTNFDIYQDDGIQHICRLMGTYQSIEDGHLFPVIMSAFCNNFGYSWNIFYSPITAYIPLLFKILTNSFVICFKLFAALVTFLTGITMFEFINKVTKNKWAGILGAAIYMFAPYRLTDMYTRIAIAELTSFIFIPMVFHGMYNIFNGDEEEKKKKSGLLLTAGAVGLILSHIIIAMYTAIFAFIYLLINIKKLKNKEILKKIILNVVFILLIVSFFILPLLEHRFATQYEVFKPGRMEREEVLIYYKLDILDLFYTPQGDKIITEIGLISIIGVILSGLAIKKLEKRYMKLYIFSLIAGIISIIMTLKWFPFEKLPDFLTMLQFSFRMLEFSSFFLSFIVAINYSLVINKFSLKDVIVLSSILILLTYPLTRNLNYRDNIKEESLWPAVNVTENTGRVHAGCASFEYLPSKAFDNLDYIKTREDKTYILSGDCEILSQEKNGTDMKIQVTNISEDTTLELPYIYYLGYEIELENNSNITKLKSYESENGFIAIDIDNEIEEGTITIKYTGTVLMKVSIGISILGTILAIIYILKARRGFLI